MNRSREGLPRMDRNGHCWVKTFAARRREGSLSPFLLVALVALLALLALAFNFLSVSDTQLELQTSAEAAALAGLGTFVDDRLLLVDPAVVVERMAAARDAARAQAARNLVRGFPLVLDLNLTNQAAGDIVSGRLDTPRSQVFVTETIDPDAPNPLVVTFNALRVRADRSDARNNPVGLFLGPLLGQSTINVRDFSTALLDRDVVGFRPWGTPNVPLVPLPILSDPTGTDPRSWEYQVELLNGADAFQFDRVTRAFSAGSDGLHEMELFIALDPGQLALANVALLDVGAIDGAHFAEQIASGTSATDLQAIGGQILLDDTQQVLLPGEAVGPPEGSADLDLLRAALEALRLSGAARVFPLYAGIDPGTGNVIVTGFVAARIVAVDAVVSGQPLRVVVQPAMICTATALTDAARRQAGTARVNAYVCKMRVVE
jgi:hypothetical protein